MDRKLVEFEIRFYEGIIKNRPNYVDALIPLADAYTRNGELTKGLSIDQRLSRLCKRDPIVFYNLACSYALVGKKRLAISKLRKSVELGYHDLEHLKRDPDLKSLHQDTGFEEVVRMLSKVDA